MGRREGTVHNNVRNNGFDMPDQSPTPADPSSYPPCVEHGVWTPIPRDLPGDAHHIKLKDLDPDESHRIRQTGVLSFHTVGCSGHFGNHVPGLEVAKAMAAQVSDPNVGGGRRNAAPASFLFHLGDVVYKDEDPTRSFIRNTLHISARFLRSQGIMMQRVQLIGKGQLSITSCKISAPAQGRKVMTTKPMGD
jgi:hypothetical protein